MFNELNITYNDEFLLIECKKVTVKSKNGYIKK